MITGEFTIDIFRVRGSGRLHFFAVSGNIVGGNYYEFPGVAVSAYTKHEEIGALLLALIEECRCKVDEPGTKQDAIAAILGVKDWQTLAETSSRCMVTNDKAERTLLCYASRFNDTPPRDNDIIKVSASDKTALGKAIIISLNKYI